MATRQIIWIEESGSEYRVHIRDNEKDENGVPHGITYGPSFDGGGTGLAAAISNALAHATARKYAIHLRDATGTWTHLMSS